MGNMLSIKPDVDDHIRLMDDKPRILLEIYQSDRNKLSTVAKREGHASGVCEGLCCVWAKYNCSAGQDYFIAHFDPEIIDETVEAHSILKNLKEQARGRLKECESIVVALSTELNPLLSQPASIQRDQRIKEIDIEARVNGRDIDIITESCDDLHNVIHGLRRYQRRSDLDCAMLVAGLNAILDYCVRTNNVCLILLHKPGADRTQAGHCIGFAAEGKRKIHFIDPNSCLYEFESADSCIAYFTWYWKEYYQGTYSHYTRLLSGLAMFS